MKIPGITFKVIRARGVEAAPVVDAPAIAAVIAHAMIPDDGREHMGVILLASTNRAIGYHEVGVGGVSEVQALPRDVFIPALRVPGCASIIVVHNHPGGDVRPSKSDVRHARELRKASALLDIAMHDYLIIRHDRADLCLQPAFYSFEQKGRLKR